MQIANTCLIGPKHLYAPLHGSEKLMEKLFSNKKIHKYIISSFQKRKKNECHGCWEIHKNKNVWTNAKNVLLLNAKFIGNNHIVSKVLP